MFDQIREEESGPEREKRKRWGILLYNGLMNLTGSTFRLMLIVLVSIVGSVALTVLVTAIYQNSTPVEVWVDFLERTKAYFV